MEVRVDQKSWFYDIQQYLDKREYPADVSEKDKIVIRKLSSKFILHQGVLYKKTSDGMQLHYLEGNKVRKVMTDVHKGVYGPHMNGTMLARKIMRQGFFWMTMVEDCIKFTKRCHKCQIHGDVNHLPLLKLHTMSSPWPFSVGTRCHRRDSSYIIEWT